MVEVTLRLSLVLTCACDFLLCVARFSFNLQQSPSFLPQQRQYIHNTSHLPLRLGQSLLQDPHQYQAIARTSRHFLYHLPDRGVASSSISPTSVQGRFPGFSSRFAHRPLLTFAFRPVTSSCSHDVALCTGLDLVIAWMERVRPRGKRQAEQLPTCRLFFRSRRCRS